MQEIQPAPTSSDREFRTAIVLVVASLVVLAIAWIPGTNILRRVAGTLVTVVMPGWLLLMMFRWNAFHLVERSILAIALSLSVPYLVLFALFFAVKFEPTTTRIFLTVFVLAEDAILLLVKGIAGRKRASISPLPIESSFTTALPEAVGKPRVRPRQRQS